MRFATTTLAWEDGSVRRMFPVSVSANLRILFRCFGVAIALTTLGAPPRTKAGEFEGPNFRKGLWHFVRTLDLVAHKTTRHRLLERELTACVDPTQAMKATFASPSIGNCVSAKPEKVDNKYIFSNRCDYMGPVSTTITVNSDESYTELNELHAGNLPREELVVAQRMGDCHDPSEKPAQSSALSH